MTCRDAIHRVRPCRHSHRADAIHRVPTVHPEGWRAVLGLLLNCAAYSHVLQQANPSILAFLGTGSQSQHLFVSGQINTQSRQDNGGISLVAMTNAEMSAVQVQDTPVLLQRSFSPSFKLLRQGLVEA